MIKKIYKQIRNYYFSMLGKFFPTYLSKKIYYKTQHKKLNLKNPKEFNEKLMFLKLNDYKNNQLVIDCADKYKVREFVTEHGLSNILNELYFIYDYPEQIEWDKLPNKFVLKWNFGCGFNIICKDKMKLSENEVVKKMKQWRKKSFGYETAELHYTKIKPRIICEKLIETNDGELPNDYKVYCFNGRAKAILVCSERDKKLKLNIFDCQWNQIENIIKPEFRSKKHFQKPKNLNKMIEYAEILAEKFKFVRVDFYNDEGRIIFGEMTFTPAACNANYYSRDGDKKLGDWLKI